MSIAKSGMDVTGGQTADEENRSLTSACTAGITQLLPTVAFKSLERNSATSEKVKAGDLLVSSLVMLKREPFSVPVLRRFSSRSVAGFTSAAFGSVHLQSTSVQACSSGTVSTPLGIMSLKLNNVPPM
jgi:hypothetical protein